MRIKDLSVEEGFMDGFRKGYGKPMPKPEKKATLQSVASSPFSSLSTRDAKDILHNILNKQDLDSRQLSMLQKIYNKL